MHLLDALRITGRMVLRNVFLQIAIGYYFIWPPLGTNDVVY